MPEPTRADEKETPLKQEQISTPKQGVEAGPAPEAAPETLAAQEAEPRPEGEVVQVETKGKAEQVTEETVSEEPVITPRATAAVLEKDRLEKEIEAILEEDLTDLYLKMPPVTQQEFKLKGEETVSKVRQLVAASKINAKKIFQLIREWLKIIPGVNKFFLAQEAKIKTDKILLVTEEEKKRAQDEL